MILVEPGPIQTPIWSKSRALAERLAQSASPQSLELYAEDAEIVRRAMEKLAEKALPAQHVADDVVHALTARHPKIRYFGTWATRLCFKALRMLPDRVRDRILLKGMGLKT